MGVRRVSGGEVCYVVRLKEPMKQKKINTHTQRERDVRKMKSYLQDLKYIQLMLKAPGCPFIISQVESRSTSGKAKLSFLVTAREDYTTSM